MQPISLVENPTPETAMGETPVAPRALTPLIGDAKWTRGMHSELGELGAHAGPATIVGLAGSGKTLLAEHIHAHGTHAHAPCTLIDLARVPHEVVESELFGYVRGGFLTRRSLVPGRIASIGHGTCIVAGLDTLPAPVQARCVSWLTEGCAKALGAEETIPLPARIIFEFKWPELPKARETSLIPPLYEIAARRVILVPSLETRREDILPIAHYYGERYAREWGLHTPTFAHETEKFLKRARWTENVRSLIQSVAQALHHVNGGALTPKDFPLGLARQASVAAELGIESISLEEIIEKKLQQFFERLGEYDVHDLYDTILAKVEKPLIKLVLERTVGNQVRAARVLGINRNTLRSRIAALSLTLPREKT